MRIVNSRGAATPDGRQAKRRRRVCENGHALTTYEVDAESFREFAAMKRLKDSLEAAIAAVKGAGT